MRPLDAVTMMTERQDEIKSRHDACFDRYYERQHTLGKGNFGKVYKARHIQSGKQCAVKVMDKRAFKNEDQRQHVISEREICKTFASTLSHKHIVDVYEVFEEQDKIYVVMELVDGGELFDKIREMQRVEEPLARRWFYELVNAVHYIHKHGIVHRDLKPENVLIDSNQHIRLCDFGFGKFCRKQDILNTYCGSPFYAAPEMVTATPYQGPPADMWSCGVILFAMLFGTLPFQGTDMSRLFKAIHAADYKLPFHPGDDVANLLAGLLCREPSQRLTAKACLEHPWVKAASLEASLPKNPSSLSIRTAHSRKTSPQRRSVTHAPTRRQVAAKPQSTSSPAEPRVATVKDTPTPLVTIQESNDERPVSPHQRSKIRFLRKMFGKKAQVVPSHADKPAGHTAASDSSSGTLTKKKKIKRAEMKVVDSVKCFLKSAFQRRLT